jgi:uncharacterized membrane protein
MDFGTLHFQILHFPIALILAAALAELLALITRRDFFADAGKYCILGAALMAIPTVLAGDALADEMAARTPGGEVGELVDDHCDMGFVTLALAMAAAAVRVFHWGRLSSARAAVYGLLLAGATVMVMLTAHWGGMAAFGPDYLKG